MNRLLLLCLNVLLESRASFALFRSDIFSEKQNKYFKYPYILAMNKKLEESYIYYSANILTKNKPYILAYLP